MSAPTSLNEQVGDLVVGQLVNKLMQFNALDSHAESVDRANCRRVTW